MPLAQSWQQGLQQLCDQGSLAGYALLTHQGQCEVAQGLLSTTFDSGSPGTVSPAAQQFHRVFDSEQLAGAFVLLGQKVIVYKQTPCDMYAISRRKQLGLCLNNLPFGLLISVFKKPQLPQAVIPKLESACSLLRL